MDGRWVAAAEIFASAMDFGMVRLGDRDGFLPFRKTGILDA